jgi:hypothetical protein
MFVTCFTSIPAAAKAACFAGFGGTAEAVPFPKPCEADLIKRHG